MITPPCRVDARVTGLHLEDALILLKFDHPAAQLLNSSEELQQDFVGYIFDMWDHYWLWLKAVCFVELRDRTDEEARSLVAYYGNDDERFAVFLSTLGWAHSDGTSKPGLDTLKGLAQARSW